MLIFFPAGHHVIPEECTSSSGVAFVAHRVLLPTARTLSRYHTRKGFSDEKIRENGVCVCGERREEEEKNCKTRPSPLTWAASFPSCVCVCVCKEEERPISPQTPSPPSSSNVQLSPPFSFPPPPAPPPPLIRRLSSPHVRQNPFRPVRQRKPLSKFLKEAGNFGEEDCVFF